MSNGELHAREREDLALHVERCAERYTAVRAEICGLRKQTRRIEAAIWGIVAVLVALGAGGALLRGGAGRGSGLGFTFDDLGGDLRGQLDLGKVHLAGRYGGGVGRGLEVGGAALGALLG